MDAQSGKRAINGLAMPRRVLRNTTDNRDENNQLCSRLGCSGRLNHSSKSGRVGTREKPGPSWPAFNSSKGKDVVESSSVLTNVRTACEKSGRRSFSRAGNNQSEIRFNSVAGDTVSSKERSAEVGCSSGTSSLKTRRKICHKSSSSCDPSKAIGSEKQPFSNRAGYGLRNLKCSSISDVLPHNCSTAELRVSRGDMVKRRNTASESSSSFKGKKTTEASSNERHATCPAGGISISESRGSRNLDYSMNDRAASVQTRRSVNVNSRSRGPVPDSLHTDEYLHQPGTPNLNLWSSSHFFSDGSSSDSSAYSFPGNDFDDLPSVVPFTSAELGIDQLMNRELLQQYNMDGVAQVLLALERMEHDEELTYEQLLALETNLLLRGLNLHDQHRELRLDIDNMSYEELLALEERMGTVSTALSEEALSKCLKRCIYQVVHSEVAGAFEGERDEDEIKCSICQEEYVVGDEVGKLECKHGYHVECVKEWLRLKNWCPICKASVAPS